MKINKKKTILLVALLIAVTLLSGCAAFTEEGRFWHDYLVGPLVSFITVLARVFGNNYGLAIIALTLIVRTVLLPLAFNAAKKQQEMRGKMKEMKPELDDIQKRLKAAKTKEEQAKIQQEMLALYQKHNYNPLNMGCLPMLVQMPIWMGLYYAIYSSPEIGTHNFLWFNLGRPDTIIAVLAALVYYLQFKVTSATMVQQPGLTEEQMKMQQQQMKMMGFMSPMMILIASFSTMSALALYWFFSGLFLIGQTWLTRKLYGPHPEVVEETAAASSNSKNTKKKKKK